VGLERGPLSLMSTTEELLGRKLAAPVLKIENTAIGIHRADHAKLLYPQKLALTLQTSGSCSVGIVRQRTKSTKLLVIITKVYNNIFFGIKSKGNGK
jgi:hypothetical protein